MKVKSITGQKQINTMGYLKLSGLLFGGVILPFAAVAIEGSLHMMGSMLFDPIPTIFHYLLIGAVPMANILIIFVL